MDKVTTHNKRTFSKAIYWGKLISITGGAQAFVQATGLLCGILVIRLLPVHEYAWYTITNTMLGTMTVLADGGISAGIMAQGGKVWQDKDKLGVVLATGLDLRKKFSIGSLLLTVPLLMYLLLHHGASWLATLLILLSLTPAFFAAISDAVLEIIPKLHQDIDSLQKNSIKVSLGRLVLSAMSLFFFPFTFVAILAGGIPRIYGNYGLKKIAAGFASKEKVPDAEVRSQILKSVKRILPGAIYFCLSAQITVWLISIFGSSSAVANVGALGRLAMVLTILSSLLGTLIVPRFARLPNNSSQLLSRYLQINIGVIAVGLITLVIVFLFSTQALWILGPNYSNLKTEFILCIAGNYLGLMAGTLFSLNTSRGWTIFPVVSIGINLIAIVIGITLINISTLKGLFIFNIVVMGSEVLIFFIYGLSKILRFHKPTK
jgi:O-antigen/teichoic acid export membrane protein